MAATKGAQVIKPTEKGDCKLHPHQKLVTVCSTCNDELVCIKCVTGTHKGHQFEELEDYTSKVRANLGKFVDFIEKDHCGKLTLNRQHVGQLLKNIDKRGSGKTEEQVIRERAVYIIRKVNEYADTLTLTKASIQDVNKTNLRKASERLQVTQENVTSFIESAKKAIQCHDIFDMLELETKIGELVLSLEMTHIGAVVRSTKFVPGTIEETDIPRMIGCMGETPFKSQKNKTTAAVLTSSTQETVTSLCVYEPDRALMCSDGKLKMVDETGKQLMVINTLAPISAVKIISVSDNAFLVSCSNKTIVDLFKFDRPRTVENLNFGDVLVYTDICGVIIGPNGFLAWIGDASCIAKYDSNFNRELRRESLNHVHRNHSLQNMTSNAAKQIVLLRANITVDIYDVDLNRIYTSDTIRFGPCTYGLRNVACDKFNNIYAVDSINKVLIKLNKSAAFQKIVETFSEEPLAVGLSPNNSLWVAFAGGEMKVLKSVELK